MAKAKKLPSGNWRVLVYIGSDINGKRLYKSFTHENRKQAEYMAVEFAAHNKINAGIEKITLGEAIDRYISIKSNILSPSTVREYKRSRNRDLKGIINVRIVNLNQENIQNEINREALTHSPKSVRNMYGLLTSTLSVFRPDFKVRVTLPQKIKKEIYIPTDEDIVKLLETIKGTELEKAVLLAAFGSLRRSEIAALTDKDIKGNTIIVNKALVKDVNKKWVIKQTKTTDSSREVTLASEVINKFKGIKGSLINLNPEQITKYFRKILLEMNIPYFKFHALRHYQASILHAMGAPDKYIMDRGGWKSRQTLDNIYKHLVDKKKQEIDNYANDYFSNIMQHEMQHEKEKT